MHNKIFLLFFVFILNCTFVCAKDARSIIEDAIKEFKDSDASDASSLGEHFTNKYIDMDAVTMRVVSKKLADALGKENMQKVQADLQRKVASTLGKKLKAGKNSKIEVNKKQVESINDPVLKKLLKSVPVVIDSTKYGKIDVQLFVDEDTGRIVTAKIDGTFDMTTTFKADYDELWKNSNKDPKIFMSSLQK